MISVSNKLGTVFEGHLVNAVTQDKMPPYINAEWKHS